VNKLIPLITFSVLLLFPVGVQKIYADILYESATLGTIGQTGGISISTTQFVGSRFSISQTVQVTEIGGHIQSIGDIFGAIIQLPGPSILPSGSPFDAGEVIAFTTFLPSSPSSDISVPLSVILPPGDYALVFGSGLFGATGLGGILTNNPETPEGSGSFFFFSGSSTTWINGGGIAEARFTVNGNAVGVAIGGEIIPLDTTALLLAGAQMNAAWMIPVVLSGIGIGLFVVYRKSKNS